MDIKIQAKTVEQLYCLVTKKPFTPVVPFTSQKKKFVLSNFSAGGILPRKSPEECGVSSSHMADFLKELEKNASLNAHQVMVVQNGSVITEAAYSPYRLNIWHVTHSMCKTVTALAIGILVTDGQLSLSDKIVKIFDSYCSPISKMKLGKLTVKHLLTMSSGIALNEGVIVGDKDWLKAYLESSCKFEPGSKFQYNSLNSYVLSCVVQQITGITMFEFLKAKLFSPMEIDAVLWESCPMGRTKGGWGMYMMPEDMAKLGMLVLNRGSWNGKTIVSDEYMNEMLSKQIDTPDDEGSFGYGYHIWFGKGKGNTPSYLFSGMLGQNVHCFPDTNTVVVVTGGNNKLFGNCQTNDVIYKFFVDNYSVSAAPLAGSLDLRELQKTEASLTNGMCLFSGNKPVPKILKLIKKLDKNGMPSEAKFLAGKSYELDRHFVRLLPLFAQVISNSYTDGINRIAFELTGGKFFLSVTEGDCSNRIELGFSDWKYSDIVVNGDSYLVAAMGEFAFDEDENPVLKIKLPFIEHSNGRTIKIFFLGGGRIKIGFTEFPGREILSGGVDSIIGGLSDVVMGQITSKVDLEVIMDIADTVFEPTVTGKLLQ